MFNRKILIAVFVSVSLFTGWKNKELIYDSPKKPSKQFIVTESFSKGSKSSYKKGNVALETGSWIFDNALLGDLPADKKLGPKAARIRAGSIAMNFDMDDVEKILISHAIFGNDKGGFFELLLSTDQGKSYERLGKPVQSVNDMRIDSFINPFKGKIRIMISSSGSSRLNINDVIFKGVGNSGVVINKNVKAIPVKEAEKSNHTLSSGMAVRGKDAPPETGENSNLFFGNPSNASFADPDNYLIDQHYYTQSYNRAKGIPNWVSWHLDKSNITASAGRVNNFAAYAGLPSGWYRVQSNSYAESGFDRGHNCPSGDRTSSRNANASTFLMTNMIPQAPQNNQKPWADFEVYLREQVKKGNEVYIIMGVYGIGGSGLKGNITSTIDKGRVSVPSHIWKVALILPEGNNDLQRAGTEAKVIAINTPNTNVLAADWRQHVVSVRDIEKATGYDLLSVLSRKTQDDMEVKKAVSF
jgi:endonuclease G